MSRRSSSVQLVNRHMQPEKAIQGSGVVESYEGWSRFMQTPRTWVASTEAASGRIGCLRVTRVEVGLVDGIAFVEFPDAPRAEAEPPEELAALLRAVGDLAGQLGRPVPVIGILSIDEEIVRRWASNQDWHRGDFVLRPNSAVSTDARGRWRTCPPAHRARLPPTRP